MDELSAARGAGGDAVRDADDIKEEIRGRLPMVDLCDRVGLKLRRSGTRWSGVCPFHAEKTGSFVVGNQRPDSGHCFGCGWSGDIFAFYMAHASVDFKEALRVLAGLAGVSLGDGMVFAKADVKRVRQPERRLGWDAGAGMPSLPPLRHLTLSQCGEIAQGRGLTREAVWTAAREFRRAAFSLWPLYERDSGAWLPRCERHGKLCGLDQAVCVAAPVWPSWCAIDATRRTAEFRRLDNGRYPRFDGGEIKSWSTSGKNWPLGAEGLNGRRAVALVEGGPDMLAAYQFLQWHHLLDRVAVVCMLGASNRMREEALEHFKGCRVRIFVDADGLKERDAAGVLLPAGQRRVPGMEAAARWTGQLTAAGAAVETFTVGPVYGRESLAAWSRGEILAEEVAVIAEGLTLPDGSPVKDVNDLARCGREVLDDPAVREAWRCWDF